jgi:hypothetical protein
MSVFFLLAKFKIQKRNEMIFKVLNHPIPSENNNTNNGQIFILGSTLKYRNMIKDCHSYLVYSQIWLNSS